MATNDEILDLLQMFEAVYGNKLDPSAFRGYYLALEDYDKDVLQESGKDVLRFFKGWFPKPADIVDIAERKQRAKEREEPDDREAIIFWRAMDAWGSFCRHEITEPQFDHDLAANHVKQINGLFEAYKFEEAILADLIPAQTAA